MTNVVVVGSGPTGVHFAATLLDKGYQVLMLDAGTRKPDHLVPDASFDELKVTLPDPAAYLLGRNFECVSLPGTDHDFYSFPPSKRYVFEPAAGFSYEARGMAPLFSFARGGLAEAWTAGAYPLNAAELEAFPFSHTDLDPYYTKVARRIGINGEADDLARFYPVHDALLPPLRLSRHAAQLLEAYEHQRAGLNRAGCYVGRSRIATLTLDQNGRKACSYSGRCLWGCPLGSLYTPSLTLAQCLEHPRFRYVPNSYVNCFRFDAQRRVTGVEVVRNGSSTVVTVDVLVLAAGTLSSSRIFLESIYRGAGDVVELRGLMDNQQILMPYVNLRAIGAPYEPRSYQFHQVAIGLEAERPEEYVHGQITALTTALVHPLIQRLPLDLRSAAIAFRSLRASLGIVNVNLHDRRRDESRITLETAGHPSRPRLLIDYAPDPHETSRTRDAIARVRRALLRLGCIVPPGMTHVRPRGSGAHYTGTIPMSTEARALTLSPLCQSHDFSNLFVVDGTGFPFLPAKNITFTLMANAVRVADQAF